jgi:delta-1-pyrroline-5-carboxylate dehydrogenase (PutA C-terminal domain)
VLLEAPFPEDPGAQRHALRAAYRADETSIVTRLLEEIVFSSESLERIAQRARHLVAEVRRQRVGQGGLDAFLHEYALSNQEGVVLMCLAEAMLRIPDVDTMDKLIKDKIAAADWEQHLGQSDSLFVNASTWALMLTGRLIRLKQGETYDFFRILKRLIQRSGEPVIRSAVTQAMRILARQFVMGRTIGEALERAQPMEKRGYRHSYDMLGEAARTLKDAQRYFAAYRDAIAAIGQAAMGKGVIESPGISVKLSALHPRYEFGKRDRVMAELVPPLKALALDASGLNISLTIDAEEADRLDVSLDVIEALSGDTALAEWNGLGLAVQAYQKRATYLIDWLADMARRHRRRLMVRLVKGAYWDTEIKRSQEQGQNGYPVFTRKVSTDVSYLACARRLLAQPEAFYSQFATHNAHTVAAVLELAGRERDFEFQRLHGMGEPLYDQIVGDEAGLPCRRQALRLQALQAAGLAGCKPCRVYAPVGGHEDLLAYLVRRLLENGANSSFVNRIVDDKLPIDEIIADPITTLRRFEQIPHPRIPLPVELYGSERRNSVGVDLCDPHVLVRLREAMIKASAWPWTALPIVGGIEQTGVSRPVHDPADRRRVIGEVVEATPSHVEEALIRASRAAAAWDATSVEARTACLMRAADLIEENRAQLLALCVREAGKTINDAVAEVREAVDFCRYYAARARADFASPLSLPGPTGERNELMLHGRGVFVCLSPWNFPLSIFMGQVAAALAAGNTVIAKPAEQTPLIATAAVHLLHRAGIPGAVLHLLPGEGETVGAQLVADRRIAGVCFTGSTETARIINRRLAERDGPLIPLIAETGGQNAMIVDSTALPEQVVSDTLASAFQSAGQRCSALRVLFLQHEVAPCIIDMLAGAMEELTVGDPAWLSTDIGPVIDEDARAALNTHIERMMKEARLIKQIALGEGTAYGSFVAPAAFEIDSLTRLKREVFGPVLHVIRYCSERLDEVLDAINSTGYGLTLAIHSRIDATVRYIHQRLRVGNTYVNRNQIGAVVGVQPFGGEGLSGTGPKAGGPYYLHRMATERMLSVNTTAAGGNAALLSLEEGK